VSEPPTVATFDFDGTLSTRDCVVPFLRRAVGTLRLSTRLMAPRRRLLQAALRRDRDTMKAQAASAAFAGRPVAEIGELGRQFAAFVEANWLRQDTLGELRAHLDRGDRVAIVSASLEPYLGPLGRSIGVDAVLCTRLEVGAGGLLTGGLLGANCRGEEKLRRIDAWLAADGLTRTDVQLVAYGDSAGDLAMLRAANTAFWAAGRTLAEWRSP
jgi:phosphatidylglycerophosphatase C